VRDGDLHLVELLGAGCHCHPRTGGCLLEMVSTVPGGVWTDRPPGLDPTLGYLARMVNDVMSDTQRPALAPLVPSLAELTRMPPLDRTTTAVLVAATVARTALPLAEGRTARTLRRAVEASPPDGEQTWHQGVNQRHAAFGAIRSAVHTVERARAADAALPTFLTDAVDVVRGLHGLPAAPALTRPAEACRLRVPVESRLLETDGAGSLFEYCTAVLELWPSWLQPAGHAPREPTGQADLSSAGR
jgi:hypothetical protein